GIIRLPHSRGKLSSLSSLGDSAPERRSPGHHRQPSDSTETTGLVQRCVIIQKDEHGFGFTVSGDRIVLVQSVRPGGAAMRAGVQEGDRIVKVNGTMVTNSSHLEVVKLIKSGAYVALTLLGSPPSSVGLSNSQQDASSSGAPRVMPTHPPPPPPPPPLPPPQRITGPKPLQVTTGQGGSGKGVLLACYTLPAVGRLSLDSQDGDSGLDSGTERFPSVSEISLNRNSVLSDPGLDSPRTSPIITSKMFQHHRRQGSDTPFAPSTEQGSDRTLRPLIIGPEEDYDPGYFNNECDSLFQDLGKLKSRPAHLGVFLRYIFSQADPSPLLFYLCADVCQKMNPKESRALGKDIWNIFLEKNAVRVGVEQCLPGAPLKSRLRNGEDIRSALSEAQDTVMPEIQEQIQDYSLSQHPMPPPVLASQRLSALTYAHLSPMAFALRTYVTHAGIRGSEPRPASTSEKSQSLPDKDKWLPFFPKTKKSSGTKKDKDTMEDKKRNPILKYIGKPKSSSQSTFHVPLSPVEVKPGNVRNIIQHFENNQHYESQEPGTQRLSTGSFPEDLLETDSSRLEVKLGRSESLKGREEMKKSRKAENVPRSRSDVDMDAAAEATRLHQSASSSASSLSTRSLENPTPPYTPKMGRRSIESPNLGFGTDSFLPHLLEDDLGQLSDLEPEPDTQNWQHTMGREVTAYLTQKEIDRQEVINELFATEASHLRILRVLDVLFYQRLKKESLLSREELALLFPNLPDLIEIHNSLCESMKKLREEGPIIKEIGDLMLSRFDGPAREEIQQVAADFCAYQSIALELIKTKQRKETRFQIFMQEAESNPQCRRLQLKDLIISEMQRLTKYPLLLENVLKHTEGGTPEHEKLSRARDQCREILRHVNEAVKRAENRHRLEAYQKRLDATSLERTSNPLAAEFKNLDLTSRRMIHEGPLSWRISKDKTVDLHVLLLEDLLVLLQKQDEKLVLKCHSKTALGSADTKQTFSPVLKLNSVLIRSVATDKRALFIICTSELGPQIYELVALTSSEKNGSPLLAQGSNSGAEMEEVSSGESPPSPAWGPAAGSAPPRSLGLGSTDQCGWCPNPPLCSPLPHSADNNPGDFLGKEKPPLQQEEPEAEGSEGMAGEEEEEEEEELPAAPVPALPPAEPDDVHPQRPDPDMHLALPEPALGKGLAESALADVENLRHLLLRSLLPCRDPEPEDDLTPTPSVIGGAVQPWDAALPSQDPPVEPTGQEGKICPASSGTGPEPGDWLDAGAAEGTSPVGLQEAEMSSSAEGQSGLKVVRKAEVEGTNPAMLLPGGNQSETALREGGRANVDGNYFYVSMPAESSTEPEHPTSPTSPSAAPCTHSPTSRRKEMGPCPSSLEGPPEPPAPGLAIRDVDLIFQVIEQLILKLGQLKDVEAAHQELLQSLGQGSSADATPVGAAAPEADAWTRPGARGTSQGPAPQLMPLSALTAEPAGCPGQADTC
uniref:Rho guanine nucleotide exchange factor 11 n=1 Tax=Crocodylus porosus TaxID=8502 RepID=A0A7M4EN96_CROPO